MSKAAIAVGIGAVALGAYLFLRSKKASASGPAMSDIKANPVIPPSQFSLSLPNGESNNFGLSVFGHSSETGPLNTNFRGTGDYSLLNGSGSVNDANRYDLGDYQLRNPGWSAY